MSDTTLNQLEFQQRRINHLVDLTGKRPTVLDVSDEVLKEILEELQLGHRYTRNLVSPLMTEPLFEYGVELFGVRFVRGLKYAT